MKITIWQFLLFIFASIYIVADACNFDYQAKMLSAICVTIVIAYINDAHGELIRMFKK